MAHEDAASTKPLTLPIQIVSSADISHLLRELETLEDFLRQAAIRSPGSSSSTNLPSTSRVLDDFGTTNKLNWLRPADRQAAIHFLTELKAYAPVIHISFASDPSAAVTGKIITWFRANVHPEALLRIGLEPSLAAGCEVRTANKVFDFSIRRRFTEQRAMLIQELSGAGVKANE